MFERVNSDCTDMDGLTVEVDLVGLPYPDVTDYLECLAERGGVKHQDRDHTTPLGSSCTAGTVGFDKEEAVE